MYGMTNAAFFGKFRAAIRKEWRNSQMYKDALKRAKIDYVGPDPRRKKSMKCEHCGAEYKLNDRVFTGKTRKNGDDSNVPAYNVHHKVDAGPCRSFKQIGEFAEKMSCPSEELEVVCYFCHQKEHYDKK
jgi:ferredoxin